MNKVNSIFLVAFLIFAYSCNTDKVIFSGSVTPENSGWNKDKPATFSVLITDTIKAYSVKLKIVNTDDYRWANLFVFSKIDIPEGKEIIDTVNLILSNGKGEWTGDGMGGNFTNIFPIKQNIRFPKTGEYKFSIEQAMRCEETNFSIEGISEIGLEIVEFNQK